MMATTSADPGESALSSPYVPLDILRNSVVPQANFNPAYPHLVAPPSPSGTTFYSGLSPGAYSHNQPTPPTVMATKAKTGPMGPDGGVPPQYDPWDGHDSRLVDVDTPSSVLPKVHRPDRTGNVHPPLGTSTPYGAHTTMYPPGYASEYTGLLPDQAEEYQLNPPAYTSSASLATEKQTAEWLARSYPSYAEQTGVITERGEGLNGTTPPPKEQDQTGDRAVTDGRQVPANLIAGAQQPPNTVSTMVPPTDPAATVGTNYLTTDNPATSRDDGRATMGLSGFPNLAQNQHEFTRELLNMNYRQELALGYRLTVPGPPDV